MARTHDADLCDQVRALEKRVAELERELEVHRASTHGHWRWYPTYPDTWYPGPTITWGSDMTMGTITVGSTAFIDSNSSSTPT